VNLPCSSAERYQSCSRSRSWFVADPSWKRRARLAGGCMVRLFRKFSAVPRPRRGRSRRFRDLALALAQISRRAPGSPPGLDLAGVDAPRPGQLLARQLARAAVEEQMRNAGDTRSGGGAVGLGKWTGSNFW